jgi:spore maturation protein CgeB
MAREAGSVRTLVIGNITEIPFQNNLLPALRAFQRRGEVVLFEPRFLADLPSTGGAAATALTPDHLENRLPDTGFDLVVCLAGGYFPTAGARSLFPARTVFAGFALSDPLGLEISAQIAPEFDLFYTSDPQTVPIYASRGLTVRRCDPATDPEMYRPMGLERSDDILFLGKWTPHRDAVVARLASQFRIGVHAHAAETRWSVPTRPLLSTPEALGEALNRTKLALEFAVLDDAPEPFRGTARLTNRPQFAASCETPSLIDAFDRLPEFFEAGVEIASFRSDDELIALAGALLADDARRLEMGRRARQRVLRDHTWDRRVDAVLSDVSRAAGRRRAAGE